MIFIQKHLKLIASWSRIRKICTYSENLDICLFLNFLCLKMAVISDVHRITLTFYILIPSLFSLNEIKLGVILPGDPKYSWSLSKVLPAIRYAIENVEKQNILPNHKMVINYKDSNCSETIGPLAAIDMFMNKSADVFIGPVCDYAIAPIARFSPHWNIPVLSAGALVQNFDNKKEYKLLTRVQGVYSDMAKFFVDTVVTFNWTRLGLIYHDNLDENKDNGKSNCFFRMEAIFYRLKNTFRFLPWYKALDEQLPLKYDIAEILQAASKNVRIVVLCASADSVREIMIKAHELNFDNGEYVFFNIDLFSSKNESERPWHRENDTIERNDKAKKAYEALMTVTLRKPTSNEYREFSDEVKRRAKTKYENFTYGEEEVNSFVGAFHDAVILYAIALNETLEANRSISNGTEITRRMWNRTFKGITGNVSIDTNGDRSADYSLLDMNPTTGKFEVVANYFGNSKKYEPVPGKNIHWAGGKDRPPADTPKCGFDGSKCPPEKPFPEYAIGIIVLGTLLVIVLIASFFIYRRIKLEAELAEMNWRVKWEDIMFGAMEGDRKKRQGSNLSLARTEDGSVEGQTLIARSRSSLSSKDWCKCGQCEEPDHVRRVCCRHIDKLDDRLDGERCITSSKDFQDVVLNKQVLLTVFIHVMLARRQRGVAPHDLTPYKCRLMAARQFLCWVHSGESLKKEIKWSIPTCVTRAIRLMFPDVGAEVTSGDDAGSLSLDEMISIENINHTSV